MVAAQDFFPPHLWLCRPNSSASIRNGLQASSLKFDLPDKAVSLKREMSL
jgi:hypothetical protein